MVDHLGRETRTYEIVYPGLDEKHEELEALFYAGRMRVRNRKRMKRNGEMVSVRDLEARVRDHLCLAEKLLADKEIKELKYWGNNRGRTQPPPLFFYTFVFRKISVQAREYSPPDREPAPGVDEGPAMSHQAESRL